MKTKGICSPTLKEQLTQRKHRGNDKRKNLLWNIRNEKRIVHAKIWYIQKAFVPLLSLLYCTSRSQKCNNTVWCGYERL